MKCKQLTGKLFTTVYDKRCAWKCVHVCSGGADGAGGRRGVGEGCSSSSTGKVLCCNVSVIIIKQHQGLRVWAVTGGEHV